MKIKVFKDLKQEGWGLSGRDGWQILKQSSSRDWLDNTGTELSNSKGYGNKCLPLKIANQLGWYIPFPCDVSCYFDSKWSDAGKKALTVNVSEKKYDHYFKSHFGSGILTVAIPILFKTKRNRQLYVRGPTNFGKENVMYMDGVIETDWMNFKFTYNIRILKKDTLIEFKKDEPLMSFIPINLKEINDSYLEEESIYKEPLTGFLACLYSEKRSALGHLHGNQYSVGYYMATNTKSKEEKKKIEEDDGIHPNLKEHFWMKDYFFGGWQGKKKNNIDGSLTAPEIGCPYLHFLALKREKSTFSIKKIIDAPYRWIMFHLFRNIFFFKIFLRKKILPKTALTRMCLSAIKRNFPEKLYKKIVGNYDKY